MNVSVSLFYFIFRYFEINSFFQFQFSHSRMKSRRNENYNSVKLKIPNGNTSSILQLQSMLVKLRSIVSPSSESRLQMCPALNINNSNYKFQYPTSMAPAPCFHVGVPCNGQSIPEATPTCHSGTTSRIWIGSPPIPSVHIHTPYGTHCAPSRTHI